MIGGGTRDAMNEPCATVSVVFLGTTISLLLELFKWGEYANIYFGDCDGGFYGVGHETG
jgi:hypothetical protein